MPDRILRDELWLSDRFLDLPTDIARLAFLRFVSLADDFGNFEGGIRRLARILHACTQSKTDEAIIQTLDALMAADLIRCYQADGRDLIHIPRFRNKRWYFARKVPASPWCDASIPLGKDERAQKQGLAPEVDTTLTQRCSHVAEGVGVGVGRKDKRKEDSSAPASRKTLPTPPFIGDEGMDLIPAGALVAIAPDWELPEAWGKDAERLGWTGSRILKESEKFRQYWVSGKGAGKRRSIKGWRQSWSNWLGKAEAMA